MSSAVVPQKLADPEEVALFGTIAVVFTGYRCPNGLQKDQGCPEEVLAFAIFRAPPRNHGERANDTLSTGSPDELLPGRGHPFLLK